MRLYFPVDSTGNVNMIEKLVLGGTGTGDLPILSPTANLCAIKSRFHSVIFTSISFRESIIFISWGISLSDSSILVVI